MKIKYNVLKFGISAFIWLGLASTADSQPYVWSGSASPSDNDCFILTPAINAQAGSVWSQESFLLTVDFDLSFQIFLGASNGGADGIAFVIQSASNGLGGMGGGLGYLGISPSLAVEYDTYFGPGDPWYDHISVQKNGDTYASGTIAGPVQASPVSDNIEDDVWHTARITWDASTTSLAVYFDGVERLTYTGDIETDIFLGNPVVYWGFTGATGGLNNLQQFCVANLNFESQTSIPLSPWALIITFLLILSMTMLRYRKSF